MEGLDGVDVSWLHHSQRDHNHRSKKTNGRTAQDDIKSPQSPPASPSSTAPTLVIPSAKNGGESASPKSSPTTSHLSQHMQQRSSQRRSGSEKAGAAATPPSLTPKKSSDSSPTSPSSPSTARRNSWLGGITSKFSSNNAQSSSPSQSPNGGRPTQDNKQSHQKPSSPYAGRRASLSEATPPPKDDSIPYTPAAPKASHSSSFLQSALRRISSSSGQLPGTSRSIAKGGLCERRVMNIDRDRDRCKISELDQRKLKRVAFCVDVEIAGGPRYIDDDDDAGEHHEHHHHQHHKDTSKRLKEKGEGEALKHPESVQEDKEKEGEIKVDGETVENTLKTTPSSARDEPEQEKSEIADEEPKQEPSKKKEKKKRSEEERKERNERKRRHAEANGTIPIEVVDGEENASSSPPSTSPNPNARSQDRPTIDPVRIYRRCCQLRETPVLKKITDQLSAQMSTHAATPGLVNALDLSGYWMQLPDVVTLSDWLAVVPVKKLILENCGLGDEAIRVVLSGLLAARQPSASRQRSSTNASRDSGNQDARTLRQDAGRHGAVEKLVLKNNPKIGPEGWKHISLFLHLSRSIKAVDLSMVPFPQESAQDSQSKPPESPEKEGTLETLRGSSLVSKAIAERFAAGQLEELVMSECELTTQDVLNVVDGVSKIGLKRLGLASNSLTKESIERIAAYVKSGSCEGLDIGGNDLESFIQIIADSVHGSSLWAISLADCNLTPSSLSKLFPALVTLPALRFIDFSHNRKLFESDNNALGICRKYLPRLKLIKRFHLADVSLSAEHAVALADILPECTTLAHLGILENPKITALANAKDEAGKEEACALYASLMSAVRVSHSIVCIDVDVPSPESSEIVKALAKQAVAYSLRNMEQGTAAYGAPTSRSESALPDVLMHIVGHDDQYPEAPDADEPAPDDDYVIGGTGVVKALSICLGSTAYDSRRQSRDHSNAGSGTATPKTAITAGDHDRAKPKVVSTNLLASARKIKARLQPAIAREAKVGDEMAYRRLLFLDTTLQGIIRRFEDEYPECRLSSTPANPPPPLDIADNESVGSAPETGSLHSATSDPLHFTDATSPTSDEEDGPFHTAHQALHRNASDVSIASKALSNEEGRMHRIGQQVRRDMLRPPSRDQANSTATATTTDPSAGELAPPGATSTHMDNLRDRLASMTGDELKRMHDDLGVDGLMAELGANLEELTVLAEQDSEAFEAFRVSHLTALLNVEMGKGDVGPDAVVGATAADGSLPASESPVEGGGMTR